MNTSLEKFEGELIQVAGKIETVQSTVEELKQTRAAEEARVADLEKRMGAMESRSTALGSMLKVMERRRALKRGGVGRRQGCGGHHGGGEKHGGPAQARHRYGGKLSFHVSGGGMSSYRTLPGWGKLNLTLRQIAGSDVNDGPQGPKHLWLNFSTSPDRRK